MTHDELLARLDQLESYHISDLGLNALRAVIELHKPEMLPTGGYIENDQYVAEQCDWCRTDYPCPTIQAIENELG